MKKRILIIVFALLLCVTASFAWLSNFEKQVVSAVNVGFPDGALSVVQLDFDASMEVEVSDGVFRPLDDNENFTFDKQKMIPNAVTPFKIKIKNNSDQATDAKLVVSIKIDPEQAKTANILDVLYLDVISGDGFSAVNDYHVFVNLKEAKVVGDASGGNYLLYVYGDGNEITIPPSANVTLDCYFYYDQNATAVYQNKNIAVSFRIE